MIAYLDTNVFVSAASGDDAAKNILLDVALKQRTTSLINTSSSLAMRYTPPAPYKME